MTEPTPEDAVLEPVDSPVLSPVDEGPQDDYDEDEGHAVPV